MRPLAVTALSVVSALGEGSEATRAGLQARRPVLVPCGPPHAAVGGYIGVVAGLETHAMPAGLERYACRNNRLADLALRTDGFAERVAAAGERYGPDRIAVVVGTSTSGVRACEAAYGARDPQTGAFPPDFDYEHTHDMFSLARFVRAALGLRGPAMTLSTACASSAKSFLDASHLIESGLCDAAVVGGADSLCGLTLHGFAALDLIAHEPCRPCDAGRAGISIGEAGGFALLERPEAVDHAQSMLLGAGASSDGYHMSSPDPTGAGAIAAMRGALAGTGLTTVEVDYVNLHGTGTRANDAMEDLAVHAVFGDGIACSSTKGFTGHTLGACGIVEATIAALCLRHGFKPGCLGVAETDPGFRSRVLTETEDGPVRRVMSNAFGFGGINCSLLFGAPG